MSGRTGGGKGRGGAANDKAWASGRVLTAEQRARKQEVDRKANRFLKKEVQDRLALLEARVRQLERSSVATGPALPDRSTGIGAQDIASSGSSAIEENIPTVGGPHLNIVDKITQWNGASSAAGFDQNSAAFDDPHTLAAKSISAGSVDDPYSSQAPSNPAVGATVNEFEHAEYVSPNRSHNVPHPQLTGVFTAGRPSPDGGDLTLFLNNLVNHIRSIDPTRVCFDDQYNQDVVINAVLKGWKYALSRYEQICPLWEVLQMVDLCLFKDCNVVERISVLRMLHVRYIFETKNVQMQVEGPLPVWFQPHMSEKLIAHEPVIDHLTWPKLRERLMSTQTDVLTNKFWAVFARNLRVSWQYEPIDVMTFSPGSSLYQLTSQFESAIVNMANWRMDVNFFYEFPGLSNDIPPDNYMPMRIITPRFGVADRAFADHSRQRSIQQQQQQQQQQRRRTFPVNNMNISQQQPRAGDSQQQDAIYEPLRDHSVAAWGSFYPFEAT